MGSWVIHEDDQLYKEDGFIILDNFGLNPLDEENRQMVLEAIEDLYGRRSAIVTSQLPVT